MPKRGPKLQMQGGRGSSRGSVHQVRDRDENKDNAADEAFGRVFS